MATRANLTIVDILEQLEGNTEYDGDSDDDFEGYVDSEVVASGEDQLEVGANVDVHEEEMDDSNDRQENELPEYTHTAPCLWHTNSTRLSVMMWFKNVVRGGSSASNLLKPTLQTLLTLGSPSP